MKQRTALLVTSLTVVGALIVLFAAAIARSGGKPGGIAVNDTLGEISVRQRPAPAVSIATVDGSAVRLEDLRDKVVMVDFWSSWCPPCLAEAPVLERVYREYRGKNVEFIGVAVWDKKEDVSKFVRSQGISYPVGLDSGGYAIEYGVRGVPEKFFIDAGGNLVAKYVGPMDDATLRRVLDGLLAKAASAS